MTGAKGCIGAWTARYLLDQGHEVVALDLAGNMHRLEMILEDDLARVTLLEGDVLDVATLTETVQAQGITHICHLAGLQVPTCRAKPTLGAQVNVVGTVNVFEAARAAGLKHIAYASSIAAYNVEGALEPRTLYGVWKLANEGTGRVYHLENGISSIGLRPYIVYGLGRDFGMTSTPTTAMLSAAAGQDFHISYGGVGIYHSGKDIGMIFARAALATDIGRAAAYNPPGNTAHMSEITAAIADAAPGVSVTFDDNALPFPYEYDTESLADAIGPIDITPLAQGIAESVEGFRRALANGRIQAPQPAA